LNADSFTRKIRAGYESDPLFKELQHYFQEFQPQGKNPNKSIASIISWYKYEDELLYYVRDDTLRLCIPRIPSIIDDLISEAHDTPIAGHKSPL
jgi:hypothetical protein